MATWSGWENQFLNAAGIIVTPPNRQLLDQWASHATSSCKNNPIDLSVRRTGSTNCHANTGIHPETFTYNTHAHAASAFNAEIHQAWAAALLRAMQTGNPYQVSYTSDVASVFVSWGSVKMFNAYSGTGPGGPGGGGGGTGTKAPRTHTGWKDLRRSVNRNVPHALNRSAKLTQTALRSLGRGHKVRG